jgi:hypothetical protein
VKSTIMVGKGIVYDAGDPSIKTKEGMPGMKRGMGGAAALLSALVCVATSGMSTKPVHCILCLAENAVSNVAKHVPIMFILCTPARRSKSTTPMPKVDWSWQMQWRLRLHI